MRAKFSWIWVVALMSAGCGEAAVAPPVDAGPETHVVVVRVLGDGTGRVTGESMIDCDAASGGRCYANLTHGATLHLEASPDSGSSLVAWSPSACGSGATCDVVVDADIMVEVTFAQVDDGLEALTVLIAGAGTGSVTSSPTGIDCDVECSARFPVDEAVTLTAVAVPGSSFVGWAVPAPGPPRSAPSHWRKHPSQSPRSSPTSTTWRWHCWARESVR
ncbi:MAG: hypothetical protein IPG81_11235 [Sandaracinaceae bacterium]|nr:hypothetical protein [Sandaracinaceae bacterium]